MTNENKTPPVVIGLQLKLIEIDGEIDAVINDAPSDLLEEIKNKRSAVITNLMRVCADRIGERAKALKYENDPHESALAGVLIMSDCINYLAFADAFVRECKKDHDD